MIEKINGKRGVRIKQDCHGIEVLTCRNGYQWSGSPADVELLIMLWEAIDEFLLTQNSHTAESVSIKNDASA